MIMQVLTAMPALVLIPAPTAMITFRALATFCVIACKALVVAAGSS